MQQPPARERDGLSKREYFGYALGDTASNLFFQTFNIFITYYYVDVWGILPGAIVSMMLWVRLWDAVNDPIMGVIADRTNTRWGKFRPYLMWVAVPYGICGYLIFANPDFDQAGKLIYAYITYTLMLMAYTAINVPYSALLGVISPSSRTRAMASSFRFVGAFGGGFLISLGVRPLVKWLGGDSEVLGFQYTMAIFGILSVAMFLVCFVTTKERVTPPPAQKTNVGLDVWDLVRNWPWIALLVASVFSTTFIILRSGSTLFYFKYVVGADKLGPVFFGLDQATVFLSSNALCQMIGAAGLSLVARFTDKRRLAVGLTLATAVCYGSFYILPTDNFTLLLTVNALGSLCMGPTSALVWAMYGDVADYGEFKFGRRATGLVYSASLFALKTGSMVAGVLLPLFLAQFGFVRDVEQTPTALMGILLTFSLVPAAFAGLKAIAIWVYPLTQARVDEIETGLRARRGEATATS
jgi:GPH family glycoside/pentoside/hexuronide:cation symporter